jgi:hypothetical protein
MMPDVGLVLTVLWFVVLFGGLGLQAKLKAKNGIRWIIAILIAIPSIYILSTLF